ncbi:hypothetical protein SAMN02745194_01881 [Roseomonas rosea]|uniref:Uncharacterized protein n=1 Tax=Muricoccus roseus TaxID=198092 RepID=A0A1M6H0J0_9PROT|nr:hypothetical protein [Roseomonas rosea]SHJ15728.1 hypothetical protein SAMN02745194_01881 [Roseomonas rosea]
MLRSFAIAAAAIVALAAAHPADAAGGRRAEARSSGKAARVAAPARSSARPALTASRRPVAIAPSSRSARVERAGRATVRTAARGSARQVVASRSGRLQARAGGRRDAVRAADRRQAAAQSGRPGLRMVSLFSAPAAAASLPGRGGKAGKPARAQGRSEGRSGVWHAGLPAADGEQMDCPSGTMAVLARGHSDTFRCMPM